MALLCGVLAAACAEPTVVIQDRCAPLSDAVLLHPPDFLGRFSVGMVEGQLLFSYVALSGDPDRPGYASARWFDASLRPVTAEFALGVGSVLPAWRWVAFEGRLWAQIWTVPASVGELPLPRQQIAIYSLEPGSAEAERIGRDLPISTINDSRPDLTPVGIGSSFVSGGVQARAAGAVGHGRPAFALNAVPSACDPRTYAAPIPLMVFDSTDVYVHLVPATDCDATSTSASWEHSATLVSLRGGGLGVLFRRGDAVGQGQLWYSRVGPDLRLLDEPPLLAGSTTRHTSTPGGYEPRASAVGAGTILFTERDEENDYNQCSNLRLVEPDGSDPRHAPWQLPCFLREGSGNRYWQAVGHGHEPAEDTYSHFLSAWIVVEPLAIGHAALAWGERSILWPGYDYLVPLTADSEAGFEQGVFLTTIDGQGRRASEVVRVTPPEASAIIETADGRRWPGEFEVQAATEGDEVVVVWRDLRPDAPGYYGRRFRCSPIEE